MERTTVVQPWITDSIANTGMTKAVIAFVATGDKASLHKDLSWQEILLIWQIKKQEFEETKFFNKLMKRYRTMSKEYQLTKVRRIVKEYPEARALFLQEIPVTFAIFLCTNMAEYKAQFVRSTDRHQKKAICNLAVELTATPEFTLQDISAYLSMARTFRQYASTCSVMINMFVSKNAYDGLQLAMNYTFSTTQLSGLCAKIDEDVEGVMFDMGYLLQLFKKYPARPVVKTIIKCYERAVDKAAWTEAFLGLMESELVYEDTKLQKESNWDVYPILRAIFPSIYLTPAKAKTVLQFMPTYGTYNDIGRMLDEIARMYSLHPNGMSFEHFAAWYIYCPDRAVTWLPLYKKMLKLDWQQKFVGVVEAYTMSRDEEILKIVIANQVPKLSYPTPVFMTFFNLLRATKQDLYEDLDKAIVKEKYLAKWWRNLSEKGNAEDKRHFAEIALYFS